MPHEAPRTYPHSALTQSILAAAIRVQEALGPGLLEKPYRLCLAHALRRAGHRVTLEASLDIAFEGLLVPEAYRLDLLVDDTVIVEAKAVETLDRMHQAQLLTLKVRTRWGFRPCAFHIFQTTKGLTSAASAIRLSDQCVALWGFSWVVILTISALPSSVITGFRPRPGASCSMPRHPASRNRSRHRRIVLNPTWRCRAAGRIPTPSASSNRSRARSTNRAGAVFSLAHVSSCLRSSGVSGRALAIRISTSSIRSAVKDRMVPLNEKTIIRGPPTRRV